MARIQVELKKSVDESFDIEIEKGFLRRIASDLRMKRFAESYVVITDSKVNRLFAGELVTSLKREKLFLGKIVVPAGEESKSLVEMQKVLEKMVESGAHRKTGVIALGGGMIGDLAGFVAASFMRGIPYVQVPTTLLAMIDSSVGGKVAVDLPTGKNMVGAFWQPKKVYIDPEVLSYLPMKQWKAGIGEAVKYGAIKDRTLWDFFEQHVNVLNKDLKKFLPSDWKVVEEMIRRCLHIKAEIVMKDEKEDNLRQILNYGHTFGHVIELMSGYKVLHGEAVATGMRLAAAVAVQLRFMPMAEQEKQNKLLDDLGIGNTKTKGLIKEFIEHMKKDKKSDGKLKLVLVDRLGRCRQDMGRYSLAVDEKVVKEVLRESGLIDDKEVVRPTSSDSSLPGGGPTYPTSSWGSPNYEASQSYQGYSSVSSPSSYSSSSNYSSQSSPSSFSSPSEETDLQRRLREMRERREQAQKEGKRWLPG